LGGSYMVLQKCRNTSRRWPDSADTDILNKSEWFSVP
jgi:hypothetical protein